MMYNTRVVFPWNSSLCGRKNMNKRQRKKQQVRKALAKKQKENTLPTKSNRKERIIATLGIIAAICTIVGVIIQFFDISIPIRSKPKADIMEDSINVEYLQSLRAGGQVYPLFQDTINGMGKSFFEGNCATQVFVNNNYEDEILLDKIIFEAQDIEVNTRPVLRLNREFTSFEYSTEIGIDIANIGWGDAKNIIIQFEDMEGNIDEYLKPEKQSIEVPLVRYGDYIQIKLWDNTDFLKEGNYKIKMKCMDKEGDIEIEGRDYLLVTVKNGEFLGGGTGAPSMRIYGIRIDTSEESYKKEEAISESIKANERLELPICFSADKSCKLDFRVGFEVIKKNNKKETIWTEWAELELKISSVFYELDNVEDYSKEELTEKAKFEKGRVIVTYPYIDKDILKYAR